MIAKEYFNGDWDKVTDLNIYTFNHRCKYFMHQTKKKNSNKRK